MACAGPAGDGWRSWSSLRHLAHDALAVLEAEQRPVGPAHPHPGEQGAAHPTQAQALAGDGHEPVRHLRHAGAGILGEGDREVLDREVLDRKSTRLNSSHVAISYAVFC